MSLVKRFLPIDYVQQVSISMPAIDKCIASFKLTATRKHIIDKYINTSLIRPASA
jgi:hypothetical protein